MCPWRTANSSGVQPFSERELTSAPYDSIVGISRECPSAAAHMSAVCPRHVSAALTSAPRLSSNSTSSCEPVRAAVISAVSPSAAVVFGSAPASSNCSAITALPLMEASEMGRTP